MQPIRTFEVVPFLPPELEHLRDLAFNLRWTWDHETINLFRRLDRDLWESTGHNPVLMLGSISQERLNEAAGDEGFRNHVRNLYEKLQEYLRAEHTWFDKTYPNHRKQTVAYFSAEFGITESLPIYSGGLGILAGDHVKAASELGLPLVGMGIVYQQGYFRQYLNPDGWQQQRYPMNDFWNMAITQVRTADGAPLVLDVDFPGRKVFYQVWKAQVGRVPLYLLDTNIPQNNKKDEDITDALYHGDPEIRIQQEIILGIGGFRALKAMGIDPAVCHMNEGHSAFLALERIRTLMEDRKLSFAQAKEVAAAGNVFTTHTAVPAGFDKFSPDLIEKYLGEYYRSLGLDLNGFMALARANQYDSNEPFNMAYLAIDLSSKTNAVARLHGEVSRQLFGPVWKDLPEHEVPITYITNGIHTRSWISDQMAELYDRYLGPTWSEESTDQNVWKRVEDIPDEELWRIHERRRERLVQFARRRVRKQMESRGAVPSDLKEAAEVLNPEILTIGFARRVATYKRATLLLKDPERLTAILNNKERPVQIIIAGKAHPEDTPAKELIRELIHFARRPEVKNRFVFIEDYDMNVARYMVQGADVWLNTPRRYLEACGTSGMKVTFNGGINVSVLDGWWDEAYNAKTGWAIGHGEVYDDPALQDTVESDALYDLLEKEIIPLFYDRDRYGRPGGWINRMKTSMLEICPVFNINRMVREYTTRTYVPSMQRFEQLVAKDSVRAKDLASWKDQLVDKWRGLRIESIDAVEAAKVKVGDDMRVRARVNLGTLEPNEVAVQIFHGPLDARGEITEGEIIPMTLSEQGSNGSFLFSGAIRYFKSGRHGFTVRVLPHHDELASPFETRLITWAD